jgi:hypothetical protein
MHQEWSLLGHHAVWLVRTDVSEEFSASIIRVTIIGELGIFFSQRASVASYG